MASYPKSGSTWMLMFLAEFMADSEAPLPAEAIDEANTISSDRLAFDEAIGLHAGTLSEEEVARLRPEVMRSWSREATVRRFVRVLDANVRPHGGDWLYPADITSGAVHVVRNPLDVVISMAEHDEHGDIDRSIAILCDSANVSGGDPRIQLSLHVLDWSSHCRSWQHPVGYRSITVRYEDLVSDPVVPFSSIVEFLELPGAHDRDRVERAAMHCTFERFTDGPGSADTPADPSRRRRFARTGRPGGWVEALSETQIRMVVDSHGEVMTELGYVDSDGRPTL